MGSFQLADVVGIIDVDGFTIKKMFYSKALGIIRIGEVAAKLVFFDIGICWGELTAKTRRRVNMSCEDS